MGFVEIENMGKQALEQFPVIKRSAKRVYQLASVIMTKEKFKSEGDVVRVSPDDGVEYFYGYYDKSPWDATDRYMICIEAKQAYKSVAPKEPAIVGVIDTVDENKFIQIGVTHSWNVQQSCMAQWMGPDFRTRIIYNDFRDGKYCSVIYNWDNKQEEKVLPLPIYDVSRDGRFALSLDFSRLHRLRPGYGYSNLPDVTKGILCPDQTCIWKMDISSGEVTGLFKYLDFAAFEPDETMEGAEHKVNHLMISPNGKRFMVLHRWFQKGRKHTRLVTVNVDKTEMYNLSDDVFVSHCYWKNDQEILSFLRKKESGNHYYLMKDKTREYKMYWPELNTDGHCSYSPDGKYIITDTYPNRKRIASVYLCTEEDNRSRRIARVFSPFRYDNDCRCDLHPRWNRKGDKVCIDSVHEGKRGLYVIRIGSESEYNPQYNSISVKHLENSTSLKHKIENHTYVSFDIFDTLLKRDVAKPQDVFLILGIQISRKLGINVKDFAKKRIDAEKTARRNCTSGEVCLSDIYSCFEDNEVKSHMDRIISMEEYLELVVSTPNAEMKKVYDWCIAQGKTVFIISDMYLSQNAIERILAHNDYRHYTGLYVSSTTHLRKARNGELFRYVCKENAISPKELVHIGDSNKSDYINAKKAGCAAVLLKDIPYTFLFHKEKLASDDAFAYSVMKSFCENRPAHLCDEMNAVGYEAFGPLLLGFCKWLKQELESQSIHKVFFFARDGLIIKRAFNALYPDSGIETHYLEVSRRSLRVPQLWMDLCYESVLNSLSAASVQSLVTFFDSVGLKYESYASICEEEGLTASYTFKKKDALNNEKLKAVYKRIENDILENSQKEYELLKVYLEQENFCEKVAVVDIGWRGSMQKFLMKLAEKMNLDVIMYGYYIGLAEGAQVYAKELPIKFKGYVFDCVSHVGEKDLRNPFVGLIETLFLASTGSTEKYAVKDGTIEAVRYPNEYEVFPRVMTIDAQKVKNIQEGAMQFINDSIISVLHDVDVSSKSAFQNLLRIGVAPSKQELRMFGDMEFRDGEILYLAKPKSILKYALKPKSLIKDFYNSRWKIGFMKRLLKMPLPYTKMYELMKKI